VALTKQDDVAENGIYSYTFATRVLKRVADLPILIFVRRGTEYASSSFTINEADNSIDSLGSYLEALDTAPTPTAAALSFDTLVDLDEADGAVASDLDVVLLYDVSAGEARKLSVRDLTSSLDHDELRNYAEPRHVDHSKVSVFAGAGLTGGGTIDEPIGRHPRQRKKMAVVAAGGKPAITHYKVTKRFAHHTRIAVNLETGRTHQIRVHMAHRHYPLIGDPLYGGRPRIPKGASERLIDALRGFPRQALHAEALGLIHPVTGEAMQFDCPLPPDMVELLQVLKEEDSVSALRPAQA
jgi:hypothetical protein